MTLTEHRIKRLRTFLAALFEPTEPLVQAVVADGWPRPMVEHGLAFHRESWDADGLVDACQRELAARTSTSPIRVARTATHLWPALPGAGLTPVFFAYLLGAEHQWIRPSSSGQAFADCVLSVAAKHWEDGALSLAPEGRDGLFGQGEVFVVSGTDETCEWVRERLDSKRRLIAYNHRVSFAVVVDDGRELSAWAKALAVDTVMWHQRGCFSPRAVIFCGTQDRLETFAEALGAAIADIEHDWDARGLDTAELAHRMQRRAVAEFRGRVFGDGLGWVETTERPFCGDWTGVHALSIHRIDAVTDLPGVVDVSADHLQGAGLAVGEDERPQWDEALRALGTTRVCPLGRLQAPPASWLHDGRSNVEPWLLPGER